MKKLPILLLVCGCFFSCKEESINMRFKFTNESINSILKHSFNMFDANRTPIIRIWIYRTAGKDGRIYQTRMFEVSDFRSKDFAALFAFDIGDIKEDDTYKVLHKKSIELKPKNGWAAFNRRIMEYGIWEIPRLRFNDSIIDKQYPPSYLAIEFTTLNESYIASLAGVQNLDKLYDKKSLAICNFFQLVQDEFGFDFMNFDFDTNY